MSPNSNFLISCNFSPSRSIPVTPTRRIQPLYSPRAQNSSLRVGLLAGINHGVSLTAYNVLPAFSLCRRKGILHITRSTSDSQNPKDPLLKEESGVEDKLGDGNGGDTGDWTTSALLFGFWAGLMYYVFMLTPNQTPSRDMYFLQKLLNLKGDDGFIMNEVLVSLWYIMGLWPLLYCMLLLPSGRSSRSKIPAWPFLVLSFFGGAYALIPYFVIWKPPPPPIEEAELGRWPLNFLDSKITAGILFAAGLGIIAYAGLASGDVWKEFYQYFRESKFIHVTCLDFALLSTFAPFWVYNDMTSRNWSDKGSWLQPISLVPFLGPALYVILRPSLSDMPISLTSSTTKQD
ncbi:uncharacterized protein LOC122094417 [Macadamia integrifolia]|uniref:uncharacterized protein LOC122094417 n=1 Tax=Macadamia integrifolia TaxID=60698 RepID=UPI001C52D19B|nr:uncharacterized protein LOC122094417 [Macadamia integrifolia]